MSAPLLIEEFLRVTTQPPLLFYISGRERRAIAWFLHTQSRLVFPTERLTACRDVKDNLVLEAAVAGRVDVLVSGDRDLLTLHPYRDIAILTPRQFLRWLRTL